jgi:hypothetical protein
MKGALAHALRTELTVDDRESLLSYMATLTEEDTITEAGDGR